MKGPEPLNSDADILRARLQNDEFIVGQVVEEIGVRRAQPDFD